jgi:insertion element IS1 protein InsB
MLGLSTQPTSYGKSIKSIRSTAGVEVVELDEMHTYIGSRKTIAGSGWLLIEMANDSSTAKWVPAAQKQDESDGRPLKNQPITQAMSDYWWPYEQFVPKELHTQSKAEAYTEEGYNSLFRHFLARLRRKSKCYSKSKDMLK